MADQDIKLEFEPAFVPETEIIIPLKRVLARPTPAPFTPTPVEKRRLILNIETTGLKPWEHRIIAIGYQDPEEPTSFPSVIMLDDETRMIEAILGVIQDGGYNELVGYGLSFDYRFILLRAMKHGIPIKEFYDASLYDLMQAMAQGKFAFVYFPQKPPKLSDLADFLWSYPKPFTDLEMIKFYAAGEHEKVVEFTKSQINRILALYYQFRATSETTFSPIPLFQASSGGGTSGNSPPTTSSLLTIPEAQPPDSWIAKCPVDLSEHVVSHDITEFRCPIDGTTIQRP